MDYINRLLKWLYEIIITDFFFFSLFLNKDYYKIKTKEGIALGLLHYHEI